MKKNLMLATGLVAIMGADAAAVGSVNGAAPVAPKELTPEEVLAIKNKKAEELRAKIADVQIGITAMESMGDSAKTNTFYIQACESKAKFEKQLAGLFKEKESDTKVLDCKEFIAKLATNKNIMAALTDLRAKHKTEAGNFALGISVVAAEDGTITLEYAKAVKPAAPSADGSPRAAFGNGGSTFMYKGVEYKSGRQAYEALMADGHLVVRTDFSGFNAAKPVRALMASKPELGITETAHVAEAPKVEELPAQ